MRKLSLIAALASAGILVACGGSSGGDAPAGNGNDNNGGATGITLTGVVAKGAALAGATVTAKCASGTVTPVTSGADGSYTLTIADGTLPCVLEATGTGADAALVLHSVATGTSSATANITPLTELLVAQLTGQDPAAFMAGASASDISAEVTSTDIGTAQSAVLGTLTAAGVDTSAITNVVSGTLVAATGSTSGNDYDVVLDNLAAALSTGGSTLAQLTETVATTAAASQTGGSSTPPAETSPLPADLLLRAKASNCDSLRSTTYRIVKLTSSSTVDDTSPFTALETASFDASTLTATFPDSSTLAFTPNGNCRYTLPEGEAIVSPAGVMVLRHMVGADDDSVGAGDRDAYRLMIGLPVQQGHQLTDLAGTWNFIGMDRDVTAVPSGGTLVVDANGVITSERCFNDPLNTAEASCTVTANPAVALATHADGGFTLTSTDAADPWVDRVFTFRAGNGELLLLTINNHGEFAFGTRRHELPLPTVGDVQGNMTVLADGNMVAGDALQTHTHTIASVDAATRTVVRNTAVGSGTVTHPQTLVYDDARIGYLRRNGGAVVASDGSSMNVRPMRALPLRGVGLTAVYLPNTLNNGSSNARFAVTVRD